MSDIAYTQNNTDQGELKIQVTARGSNRPITNARIAISYSGDPDSIVEEVNTDASGMSEQLRFLRLRLNSQWSQAKSSRSRNIVFRSMLKDSARLLCRELNCFRSSCRFRKYEWMRWMHRGTR